RRPKSEGRKKSEIRKGRFRSAPVFLDRTPQPRREKCVQMIRGPFPIQRAAAGPLSPPQPRSGGFKIARATLFTGSQAAEAFGEKKEHARPEAKKHDRQASGNTPEGAEGGAATVPVANDDIARNGHENFENAAAQEPARGSFHDGVGVVVLCETIKHQRPKEPEHGNDDDCADGIIEDGRFRLSIRAYRLAGEGDE